MANYMLTNKAVEDLSKIWDYTFEVWSEVQADKYYYMLQDSFDELASGKVSGKNYAEVRKDLFGFKAGQPIIFYRKLKSNRIEISRKLHSRMDLKTRLAE
jgi:toxin ParE1/3/4